MNGVINHNRKVILIFLLLFFSSITIQINTSNVEARPIRVNYLINERMYGSGPPDIHGDKVVWSGLFWQGWDIARRQEDRVTWQLKEWIGC